MKAKDFRRIALGLGGATEKEHMGHPDFRANGRIFATLHADLKSGMVKLTPDEQSTFIERIPTRSRLKPVRGAEPVARASVSMLADEETLGEAMTLGVADTPARRRSPTGAPKKKVTTTSSTRSRQGLLRSGTASSCPILLAPMAGACPVSLSSGGRQRRRNGRARRAGHHADGDRRMGA